MRYTYIEKTTKKESRIVHLLVKKLGGVVFEVEADTLLEADKILKEKLNKNPKEFAVRCMETN
jgi:hypothetical protein